MQLCSFAALQDAAWDYGSYGLWQLDGLTRYKKGFKSGLVQQDKVNSTAIAITITGPSVAMHHRPSFPWESEHSVSQKKKAGESIMPTENSFRDTQGLIRSPPRLGSRDGDWWYEEDDDEAGLQGGGRDGQAGSGGLQLWVSKIGRTGSETVGRSASRWANMCERARRRLRSREPGYRSLRDL